MMLGSFFFKNKARRILQGKWQTALLVTFFAGIVMTLAQVAQTVSLREVQSVMNSLSAALNSMPEGITTQSTQYHEVMQLYRRLFESILSIPQSTLIGLILLNLLALLVSPMLIVGCNQYFIRLLDGKEMPVHKALVCRFGIWHRVLWLYLIIFVKIFLWSLLFLIPGIIAAIRYSMAPYYLAEHPEMTAREALSKSKESMKNMKMTYFMLSISFVGWNLLITVAQMFLVEFGPIVSLVAAQFMSLAVNVYMNASFAVFYAAVSREDGVEGLVRDARSSLRQMGMEDVRFPHEDDKVEINEDDGGDEE